MLCESVSFRLLDLFEFLRLPDFLFLFLRNDFRVLCFDPSITHMWGTVLDNGYQIRVSTSCLSFSASSTYRPPADIEYCPVQSRQGHKVLARIEIFGKGGKFVVALLLLRSDRKPDRGRAEGKFVQVKRDVRHLSLHQLNHKARREVCTHSFVL
jgi:hypothetical protein